MKSKINNKEVCEFACLAIKFLKQTREDFSNYEIRKIFAEGYRITKGK